MAQLRMYSLQAAACCALASLSGCNVVTTNVGRSHTTVTVNGVVVSGAGPANSAVETVQKTFKAASVATLQAEDRAGSIEIRSIENGSDEIHVTAAKTIIGGDSKKTLTGLLASVTIQADLRGDSLVLSSNYPADFDKRNISVSIDYVVTVPQRMALDLITRSGSITVNGIGGREHLHSDYGNIDLKSVGSNLDVSTNSGAISIENAPTAKEITAKTSYGNISLTQVAGDLDAATSSGTLTVNGVQNAQKVKLHSGYGNVRTHRWVRECGCVVKQWQRESK